MTRRSCSLHRLPDRLGVGHLATTTNVRFCLLPSAPPHPSLSLATTFDLRASRQGWLGRDLAGRSQGKRKPPRWLSTPPPPPGTPCGLVRDGTEGFYSGDFQLRDRWRTFGLVSPCNS